MALSSVKHNKPVLPRTSDGSDLGSNRASIYSGKALSFDGVNDHVGVDSSFMPDNADFSVSLYVKINTIASPKAIIGSWDSSYNGFAIGISQGRLRAWANDGANSGLTYVAAANLVAGIYYHVTLSYDYSTGTQTGYLNGVNIGSDAYPDTMTHNAFNIAKAMAGYGYGDVDVSDVRVYNSTITDAQAKEIYDNPEQSIPTGFSSTNLILHLPMTEGAGSYVYNANAGAIGTELISNAGFDETCQKWGTTDSSTVEISGGKAIWSNAPLSGSFVEQPLELEAGKFYRVSFDYTSTMFNIFVNLGDTQQAVPLGNGRYSYDMYYGTGTSSLKFKHGWTTNSSASVDNVSVKEVVPNYYNGTISGATWVQGLPEPLPQTALMDWNKGTNAITDSKNMSTYIGTTYRGLTLLSDKEVSPIGTPGAYLFQENNTNSNPALLFGTGVTDNSDYTLKCWLKADRETSIAFATNGGSNVANIDVTTEWQQFSVTQAVSFQMTIHIGGFASITQASGLKLWVWHPYMYKGSGYQPYIETEEIAQHPSPVLIKEGSTAGKDVFGNTITNPRASGAFNFDGDSWAEVQDNASLDVTDAVTLECWFYWNDLISKGIFGRWHQDSNNRNYLLWKSTDSRLDFYINGSSIAQYFSLNATKGWTHIVGTYDRNTAKLYVDGVNVASTSHTLAISTGTMPLEIGRNFTTSNQAINSQLSNVRLYNYALTAQQVADNFNEKASTFGGTKVASELDAYIERTASDGATVEAHSCLVNYLTELDKK